MEISFRTRRLQRQFSRRRELVKEFGEQGARVLQLRLAVLATAQSLSDVPTNPPERRHQLTQDRAGQYAVDVMHPYRLVFEPDIDPVPRRADGGIDLDQVTAIVIVEVVNYH